jgi:hypothetical protein
MYPRQSPTTHTELLGDEVAVYDRARAEVHALNPTAARVWQRCDGATSPEVIAAALRQEMGIPEADAVVELTLRQLARVHLLELPSESCGDGPATTRRWLLGRGLAAAMLPAIYSIGAPSPVEAQSLPPPAAPTLTSVSPNQGTPGTTVAVTLTGTNFVVGATTVTVAGGGVTVLSGAGSVKVANITVSSATSLTANFVIDPTAAAGPRAVTVTTAGGTSGPQTFTINAPPPGAPTLTSVSPNQGLRGETIAVTLTGTNFVVGATTVIVAGGGVTVNNVVVGSSTSLTANFMLDLAADGPRTVTVTTAGGTSGPQTFTITLPASGSTTFNYTGSPETFTVPAGVVSVTILATGAQGGLGFEANGGVGGLGGRTTATVPVTPGASLTVRVGGVGPNGGPVGDTDGGFNGGGGSLADGGGGGGASSVRNGATPLVIVGGGGGGGASGGIGILPGGNGGAGGGLNANPGQLLGSEGGFPGGGGGQIIGGLGGFASTSPGAPGTDGTADQGGVGGDQLGEFGGGGGGGGYRGGGGGGSGGASAEGGGGGGGGGSSFTAPGATGVVHEQGVKASNGFVTISW